MTLAELRRILAELEARDDAEIRLAYEGVYEDLVRVESDQGGTVVWVRGQSDAR